MLEGLDRIDWSTLTHAYGSAEDVPDLLRHLASADEDERSEAMHELYGNIWHQGTVYEATAKAVPFLIELLEAADVEGKDEILVLLAHLARGTSYHNVHQHLPMLKEKAKTDEWRANIEKQLAWVRDVKAAVRAGEKLYLRFLDEEESVMRDSAAYLLASLERPAPALADHIWKKFESEEDESVRASLVLAFGRLAEPNEANRAPLLVLIANAESKSIKLAAAISLVHLAPDEVPEDAICILLDAAKRPEEFAGLEDSVWGKVDGVELLTVNHLTSLDDKSALAAENMLAESLPAQLHPEAVRIAEILLNLSFRTSVRRDATFDALDQRQKRIVRLIATARNVWRERVGDHEKESTKASLLFRSCGLPDKQDDLLRFIGGPSSPVLRPAKPVKRSGLGALLNRLFKSNQS